MSKKKAKGLHDAMLEKFPHLEEWLVESAKELDNMVNEQKKVSDEVMVLYREFAEWNF